MPELQTKPGTRKISEVARHVVVPSGIVETAWPSVRDKCRDLGVFFDDWQDGAGRLILALRENGKYAAGVGGVVMSIPRQVGKTYMVGAIIFALCLLNPGMTVIWTAHRMRTTKETFAAMRAMAARVRIAPYVLKMPTASGEESIIFTNGSRILFGARERGFGVGFAEVDILVVDEAQKATNSALDDMVPTTNSSKQPTGPLLFFMGTPPRPTDPGEVFTQKRTDALSGEDEDTIYIEMSADENAEPGDWAQVAKANPSFPIRTNREAILRMRKNLGRDSFKREALGIWDEINVSKRVVPADVWKSLIALPADQPAEDEKPNSLAVDMSHEGVISIDGCWVRGDESAHVEILALDELKDDEAVLAWLVERAGRRIPVVIDYMSPANFLIPLLRAKKVKVIVTQAQDMSKACGGLYSAAMGGRLTHADQDQLNDAMAGARKRPIGTAGGWGWDRKDPTVDISSLVAATLALFGAQVTKKKRTGPTRIVVLS